MCLSLVLDTLSSSLLRLLREATSNTVFSFLVMTELLLLLSGYVPPRSTIARIVFELSSYFDGELCGSLVVEGMSGSVLFVA